MSVIIPQKSGSLSFDPPDRPRVQSVARATSILLAIARSPSGLTIKGIRELTRIPPQATYHLVHTLKAVGFVTRDARGHYLIGLRVGALAEAFWRQLAPQEHFTACLQRIAQETGETAHAAGWWQGEIVVLGSARSENPIQAAEVPIGFAGMAHARASGKLLLAFAPAEVRERYLTTHPLASLTPHTITDRRELDLELSRVRRQRYAIEREEVYPGLCCLAVPFDGGISPYVLAISVPANRFAKSYQRCRTIMESTSQKFAPQVGATINAD